MLSFDEIYELLPEPTEAEEQRHEKNAVQRETFLIGPNRALLSEAPGGEKIEFAFQRDAINLEPEPKEYLLIGFDTEYQALRPFFTNKEVQAKQARYEVLSYQGYAIHPNGTTWEGIVIPDDGARISSMDFVTMMISKGAALGLKIPKTIVLVGHYTRADIPAFNDRKGLQPHIHNVRNSLVTRGLPIRMKYQFNDNADDDIQISVKIRDTMLLMPASKKSLAAAGKAIGIDKVPLADTKEVDRALKQNMKMVRTQDWPLFRKYALVDAEISAKYYQAVSEKIVALTGGSAPTALSSVGMKLLIKEWKERAPSVDPVAMVGKEHCEEEIYDEKRGVFRTVKRKPFLEKIFWFLDFASGCYQGGRNEQFWFGPSPEDNWSDLDLSGAYPTAMAMIGQPRWSELKVIRSFDEVEPDSITLVSVKFKFPDMVRYPTLPVRSSNGLIFPLSGQSKCAMPEIELARRLGCDITLEMGVTIPCDPCPKPFFPFIKDAIAQRKRAKAAGANIEAALWKEIANSCYGKTAQGLRDKRTFNLVKKRGERIVESDISNPFFAAQITSLVRAVVGEIMNSIPQNRMVFSVTTDGFITNATDDEMNAAQRGPFAQRFGKTRLALTDDPTVLERKHNARQLLGWRTRGQATIKAGEGDDGIVLARAGIKPPVEANEPDEQNDYIVKLFFERKPDSMIYLDVHTSVREMVFDDADLVTKRLPRRLGMEYDFKRKPSAVAMTSVLVPSLGRTFEHVAFSTSPWASTEEFSKARKFWNAQWKTTHKPIKTAEGFREYARFYDMMVSMPQDALPYLSRGPSGDLKRLQRDLCAAFKFGQAGLAAYQRLTATEFARLLNSSGLEANGVKTTRATVENGKRLRFKPNSTPRSERVLKVVESLQEVFPEFRPEEVLASLDIPESLSPALHADCEFISQVAKPWRDEDEYDRDSAGSVDVF